MRDDAARGKKSRELPQAAPSAAAPRTRVREGQQPHQRGASGLRRLQPPAAHGGCRAAPRPALLVPSDATARGKGPGSCLRSPPVPLHQEPGSERSSSRTRGAHLASDGPSPQLPTGAVVLLHAPLCSCPATPPCTEKSRELPQAAPSATAPRTRVREEQQPHHGGAPGSRRPPPAASTGALVLLLAPLFEPSDATVRGTKPREMH